MSVQFVPTLNFAACVLEAIACHLMTNVRGFYLIRPVILLNGWAPSTFTVMSALKVGAVTLVPFVGLAVVHGLVNTANDVTSNTRTTSL